eukprot:1392829-Prymnesium_polylepis.1
MCGGSPAAGGERVAAAVWALGVGASHLEEGSRKVRGRFEEGSRKVRTSRKTGSESCVALSCLAVRPAMGSVPGGVSPLSCFSLISLTCA